MNAALLLCVTATLTGQTPGNVDFHRGTLSGWSGDGFYVTGIDPRQKEPRFSVCSSDGGSKARKGELSHTFVVPPQTQSIRFAAHAVYGLGLEAENLLNVVLMREDGSVVPKKVRTGERWSPQAGLLRRAPDHRREYAWDVADLVGRSVRIVLTDRDARPNCYLVCSGFELETSDARVPGSSPSSYKEFAARMLELQKKHQFPAMARYDSKRFLALGNAGAEFVSQRLRYCEAFYDLFYGHFDRLGFALHPPREKLMIAVFDCHAGFEAYLGQKMPAGVTGIYHPGSNRLVLYDVRHDPALIASKDRAVRKTNVLKKVERQRLSTTIERQFDDVARDISLTTTMHEAAHQMSFNVGLLARGGDVSLWLAEGLACYCESTAEGDWQPLGSPNPGRIDSLRNAVKQNRTIPLSELVRTDSWLGKHAILGYGQSWALFRMLLHERPQQLKAYLQLIQGRKAPDHRTTDFLQCFGGDMASLDRQYREYMRKLCETTPPRQVR